MSKLTKTQIEFKKQMQLMQHVKPYKEVIDDHNDFYHNTAYEQEILNKYYKREKNKRSIIYLCILSILIFAGYKNIDKIDFDKIKANIEKSKIETTSSEETRKFSNNYVYTDNDIEQYKIGKYHSDYKKRIETINVIMENNLNTDNFYNFNINSINEQIKVINDLTYIFNNYVPEARTKYLHAIDLELLKSYKNKYDYALLLTNNYYDNDLINNYNQAGTDIANYSNQYKDELLRIFKELNMSYTIQDNGDVFFTYKNLENKY